MFPAKEVLGMEAIPVVVRRRIVAMYDQGKKTRHISEALGYCLAAVRRVRQHFQQRGTLEPQTHLCGRTGFFTPERQQHLRQLLAQKPDATLKELCRRMDRPVAVSTMDTWVKKLGLSFKKSRSAPPSRSVRTSPPDVQAGTKNSRASRRRSSFSSTNRASRAT
jgi:transposase